MRMFGAGASIVVEKKIHQEFPVTIKSIRILPVAAILFQTGIAFAEDSIAVKLADGKPWQTKLTDVPRLTMTLNPDGSGTMKVAIMKREITWKAKGSDGMCLSGLPDGTKCMKLNPIEKGYSGVADDGKTIMLTRE
jgi:hypothetical protein